MHPKNRGLRNYTLLVTEGGQSNGMSPPFQGRFDETAVGRYDELLKDITNAKILTTRLNADIVANAIERMKLPCRVVVSGPGAFNDAARQFLEDCGVNSDMVTILAA